jgi:hypothetical protein
LAVQKRKALPRSKNKEKLKYRTSNDETDNRKNESLPSAENADVLCHGESHQMTSQQNKEKETLDAKNMSWNNPDKLVDDILKSAEMRAHNEMMLTMTHQLQNAETENTTTNQKQ